MKSDGELAKPIDRHVFEIFNLLGKRNDLVKKRLLDHKDHNPMRYILAMNFKNSIQSVLPEGEPPHNEVDPSMGPGANLHQYLNFFPIWFRGEISNNTPPLKIESLFIECLENIPPEEVTVLCAAKDKKLTDLYPVLTEKLVKEIFPELC